MKLLGALSFSMAVAGCASTQPSIAPKIDGKLESLEWGAAEVHALPGGGVIRLRRIDNDLFIAVSALEPGFPTIFVGGPDAIEVLHASAAQASVKYLRSGERWIPVDPQFEYTLRQDSNGSQAMQAARDAFLESHDWLSTSDRSHGKDREFLVRLNSERSFLAISFLGVPSMNIHGWPARVSDDTDDLRLLQGQVPLDLEFSPASWQPIGQMPGNSFEALSSNR